MNSSLKRQLRIVFCKPICSRFELGLEAMRDWIAVPYEPLSGFNIAVVSPRRLSENSKPGGSLGSQDSWIEVVGSENP